MKKWILIPMSFLILVEICLFYWEGYNKTWYRGLESDLKNNRQIDYLFIGSSRVASAIRVETIMKLKGKKAYNLGVGLSTIHSHALAIENLTQQYPESFRGLKIFLEAPNGIVEANGVHDRWFDETQPRYLVEEMSFIDLKTYWNSNHLIDRKIKLSFRWLFSFSKIFNLKEVLRESLFGTLIKPVEEKLIYLGLLDQPERMDLSDRGHIRSDKEAVLELRKNIKRKVRFEIASPTPYTSFNDSRLMPLNLKLKSLGAELIIFTMPVSPLIKKAYVGREVEMIKFRNDIKSAGIKFIDYDKELPMSFFPDYLHLKESFSQSFTKELIPKL